MDEAQTLGPLVFRQAIEWSGFVVSLDEISKLSEMRVSMGMVNESVFVAVALLNGREPRVELFWLSDGSGETAEYESVTVTDEYEGMSVHQRTRRE